MEITSYPAALMKVLSGDPFTFSAKIANAPEQLIVEIWTNVHCKEYVEHNKHFFAATLHLAKKENNISVFERTLTPSLAGCYTFSIRYRFSDEKSWHMQPPVDFHVEPAYSKDLIIYNAFVRQFGAQDKNQDGIIEPGEGGTFRDLIKAMPHFKKLGITALYLNPIQKSGEMYKYDEWLKEHYVKEPNVLPVHMHPGSIYSIQDYKSIDPELGWSESEQTDQYKEFKKFVKTCHENKIRVIIDMVIHHTSKDSVLQRLHPEWYLYKRHPLSLNDPYIYPEDDPKREVWGRPEHVFSPYDHDVFWSDCAWLNWNYRYPSSPNSAPKNPTINDMKNYFKDLFKYWITQYGVDGFRLDVAYAIPLAFWKELIQETRHYARHVCARQRYAPLSSEIMFIGETYVNDVEDLQACGMTCLNGDYSAKIYSVPQLKGYLDYIYNISGHFFPENSAWLLYPECHDFLRLPKKFSNLEKENSDMQLNKSRWVLSALLPGIPLLHNGYEVVEHEQVSLRSYSAINWKSKKNITDYIAKINKIRHERIALQKGTYTFVNSDQGVTWEARAFSFFRDYQGKKRETVLTIINLDFNSSLHTKLHLNLEGYDFNRHYTLKDLLSGTTYDRIGTQLSIILEPGESHVFLVEQGKK
ncbi:MAG: alpha-amylase family glycosyl hydrolase [archaeon]